MSDDQIPAWAAAMEARLGDRLDTLSNRVGNLDDSIEARLDAREHRITVEILQAVNDLRTTVTVGFEAIRDDINVVMARAERAHDKITDDRAELLTVRKEVVLLFNRLRAIEERLGGGGPWTPKLPEQG